MRCEPQESPLRAPPSYDVWQTDDYLLRIDPEIFDHPSSINDPASYDIPDFLGYLVAPCDSSETQQQTASQAPESSTSSAHPGAFQPPQQLTADEFILRELAEIRRLLLQRLLVTQGGVNVEDTTGDNELFDILAVLAAGEVDGTVGAAGGGGAIAVSDLAAAAAVSHLFPVGDWAWVDCCICSECKWLYKRVCCGEAVCGECLRRYLTTKVGDYGQVKIECPATDCHQYVHRDEIAARLDAPMKDRFYQYLVRANEDPTARTCPKCNHVRKSSALEPILSANNKNPFRSRVTCTECSLAWCFTCHSPWHEGITCKQFRKGDRLVKKWALQMQHGQLNAQKCPKCKVFIQRTTGCDHMHCTRCKTDFCYRCGDRLRKLRFFGDHYSKLSIFGCKFRYKADKPVQRKLIRGAVFGSKLMVAPIVGTLGACAGVLALGFGLFALPVYGGVRLYQKYGSKRQQMLRLQQRRPTVEQDFDIYMQNEDSYDSGSSSSESLS